MSESAVQTFGRVTPETAEPATALLDPVDCLSAGMSLRALARHPKTPPGTREIYSRVGAQFVSAARAAIVKRGGRL